jgi:hypothetical protein
MGIRIVLTDPNPGAAGRWPVAPMHVQHPHLNPSLIKHRQAMEQDNCKAPQAKPDKGSGMPRADFVMGLILMLFGLVAMHQSLKIPTFEKDWGGFYAAPGFVPLILGGVIFFLALLLFIRAFKAGGHRLIPSRETFRAFVKAPTTRRWCLVILYSWGFFFILGHIPFLLAAFLVLLAFLLTFAEVKKLSALIIAGAASGAIYLVFSKLFLVPLP